jgi:hypothetical protein
MTISYRGGHVRRVGVLATCLCWCLCSWGCGPDNLLSGSLSEVFPLDVSRSEVARNDEAIQVTYYMNRGAAVDIVAKISVSLKGVTVKHGVPIQLAGEYEPGHPRCVVSHVPGGEGVRMLPRVKRGDFVISAGGAPGQATRGNFSMLFDAQGGDLGNGRTFSGNFSGQAADAGFGPLP